MHFLITVQHPATPDGDFDVSGALSRATPDEMFAAVAAFNDDLVKAGAWVFAGGLMPPSDITTVDATGDQVQVAQDSPIAGQVYLGGFWVIEAADRVVAADWARRASAACFQAIQLRPFSA